MQVYDHGAQLVWRARRSFEDGSKVPVVSRDYCFLGARNRATEVEVEQRGQSGSGDARWSDQVEF